MNLNLSKALLEGKFFNGDSVFVNHRIVNLVSLNDETQKAHVVLQRYTIGKGASVSTNSKQLFNTEISYSELEKVFK